MKRITQGFTLIELMIVVAIIGILAAIAIPAYNGYILNANKAKVVGHFEAAVREVSAEIKKDVAAIAMGQSNGNFFRGSASQTSTFATNEAGIVAYLNGARDGQSATVNFAPTGGAAAYVTDTAACATASADTATGQVGIDWDGTRNNAGGGVTVCQPQFGPTGDQLPQNARNLIWE